MLSMPRAMSRITIFSLDACPHCLRCKTLLASKSWVYAEISLSDYPERRKDMIAMSGAFSAPQVFFGLTHIGGAEQVAHMSETGELDKMYAEHVDGADISKDPEMEPRLKKPGYPPKPWPQVDHVASVEGEIVAGCTYAELWNLLRAAIWEQGGKAEFVSGKQLNEAADTLSLRTEDLAATGIIVASSGLSSSGVGHGKAPVTGAEIPGESELKESVMYKLRGATIGEPKELVLNTFREYPRDLRDKLQAMQRPPLLVLERLTKLWRELASKYTDPRTALVDYVQMPTDELYTEFMDGLVELRYLDWSKLETSLNQKLAFCVNLYNLFVLHAFAAIGIPTSDLNRNSFFNSARYDLGGFTFTLSELENGVLRGNRKAPSHLGVHFSSVGDPRLGMALRADQVDPRVHFALNCGAKSCPPVNDYTEEALDEEMSLATRFFANDGDNLKIDISAGSTTVMLSKIVSWYAEDFVASVRQRESQRETKRFTDMEEVPKAAFFLDYLTDGKKEVLRRVLDGQHGKTTEKFFHYDWTTNASKSKVFRMGLLSNLRNLL